MAKSGNNDPASRAGRRGEDQENEANERVKALAARSETLQQAQDAAKRLAGRPTNRTISLDKNTQILVGNTDFPRSIDGWLLYETLLQVKDAPSGDQPGLVHFGLVLTPEGRILQFMNGGKEYNPDHPEPMVHATYCSFVGPDPAVDDGPPLQLDPAGEVVVGASFWSYADYNAAGCEQALQYVVGADLARV